MMTMDRTPSYDNIFKNMNNSFYQVQSELTNHDVDWSVFENADRYLLRDDSAWITRLSKDFWWNLDRMSEMIIKRMNRRESINSFKNHHHQQVHTSTAQLNGTPVRKLVGQRSTIARPNTNATNSSPTFEQDTEYNPFQSKITFDNNIWASYSQQAIPW